MATLLSVYLLWSYKNEALKNCALKPLFSALEKWNSISDWCITLLLFPVNYCVAINIPEWLMTMVGIIYVVTVKAHF